METHSSVLAWRVPRPWDRGAWWAAIYGVTQSRTRLMRLSSSEKTDIENRLIDMQRGEEKVRCMETVTWKLTLPYVK